MIKWTVQILVSGKDVTIFWRAIKLGSDSGEAISEACVMEVSGRGLVERASVMCFDTTASNGTKTGA